MIFTAEKLLDLSMQRATTLLIGPPISGKTTSLATLRKVCKRNGSIYLFDFDHKCQPLIRAAAADGWLDRLIVHRYGADTGNRVVATEHRPQASTEFLTFLNDFNRFYDWIDPTTGDWKTTLGTMLPEVIIIDSLTSFQDAVLEFVLSRLGHNLGDPRTDSRADYGKAMGKILETIRSLKTLPCHTVVIAHETFDKDELTGEIRMEPNVFGKKLAPTLAAEFNLVLYSTTRPTPTGEIEYVWQTQPGGFIKSVGSTYATALPKFVPQDFTNVIKFPK
jgi:hypothetical protein